MPTNGTRTMSAARDTSQVTMISRRGRRSATTPPTGAANMGGTSRSTSTTATAVWFWWERSYAATMKANVATQSPSDETACPARRRPKPFDFSAPRNPFCVSWALMEP